MKCTLRTNYFDLFCAEGCVRFVDVFELRTRYRQIGRVRDEFRETAFAKTKFEMMDRKVLRNKMFFPIVGRGITKRLRYLRVTHTDSQSLIASIHNIHMPCNNRCVI